MVDSRFLCVGSRRGVAVQHPGYFWLRAGNLSDASAPTLRKLAGAWRALRNAVFRAEQRWA